MRRWKKKGDSWQRLLSMEFMGNPTTVGKFLATTATFPFTSTNSVTASRAMRSKSPIPILSMCCHHRHHHRGLPGVHHHRHLHRGLPGLHHHRHHHLSKSPIPILSRCSGLRHHRPHHRGFSGLRLHRQYHRRFPGPCQQRHHPQGFPWESKRGEYNCLPSCGGMSLSRRICPCRVQAALATQGDSGDPPPQHDGFSSWCGTSHWCHRPV